MRKLLYLFIILITSGSFSQKLSNKAFSDSGAINFLLNDSEIMWRKTYPEIINEGNKYGYSIYREEDKFLFDINLDGLSFKLLILTKPIYKYNYEFFPNYSIGEVNKYYYFFVSDKYNDLDKEKKPQIIETKISLNENHDVSSRVIDRYFSFLKNYYETAYINNFKTSTPDQLYAQSIPSYKKTNFGVLTLNDIKTSYTIYSTNPDEYGDPRQINHNVKVSYGTDYQTWETTSGEYYTDGLFGISYKDETFAIAMEGIKNNSIINNKTKNNINELKYFINDIDIREISMYDLTAMVNVFLNDCSEFNIPTPNINTLKATFEPLGDNTVALAFGMNDDDAIVIKVDPDKWQKASDAKKWYILYHELGHDVLNLEHGEGGKMMFNYAEREYTWEEFFEDKEYMFNSYK
jgi:hypothetical protein